MYLLWACLCAACLTVASVESLRLLQATGYMPWRGFFKVYANWHVAASVVATLLAVIMFALHLPTHGIFVAYALLAVFCVVLACRQKSKLRLTKRIWRLFVAIFVVLCSLCVHVGVAYWAAFLPFVAVFCWALLLPLELIVNGYYLRKAGKKLQKSGVTVLAVTGSYGKTSTKDMLCALLCGAVAPKGSCNTPLGIAAYVNKTDFQNTQFLVLEFGARKRGDVRRLCKLFCPTHGIITGVCPQHLSTFGTFTNVVAAKQELLFALPKGGVCVLNGDDSIVSQWITMPTDCHKVLSNSGVKVQKAQISTQGTQLQLNVNNACLCVQLPHVAMHAVGTFLMCLQLAMQVGQSAEQTVANCAKVTQTAHRMQLTAQRDFYILDDSYNGSIAGIVSCCATLNSLALPTVAICQGVVECGKQTRQLNNQVGKLLSAKCVAIVLLGKNAKYVAEGALGSTCKILHATNLEQAVQRAKQHLPQGGILLFQNDLPDVVTL